MKNIKQVAETVNESHRDCIISIAVHPDIANAYNQKKQDFITWVESGYIDVVTPMVPKGLKQLGSDLFTKCYSLREVVLPEGLTRISSGVFSHCTALEFVDIPETVESIESTAFYYCYALRKIKLPEQLTAIKANTQPLLRN